MPCGRIWPSSALRLHKGTQGSGSCWRSSRAPQVGRLPADAHAILIVLAAELQAMQTLIASIEKRIIAHHRPDEASKRLRSIPGIGLVKRDRHCRHDHGPKGIPVGPRYGGRSSSYRGRIRPAANRKLGPISETGRSLFATHSGGRSPCSVEARATKAGEVSLAHAAL